MTVMGEEPPATWSDELHRTGRVVFPARPRFVWRCVGFVWLFFGLTQLSSLVDALDRGGVRLVMFFLALAVAVAATGWACSLVLARRPALTVDRDGIRSGKHFLPWTEIGAVGAVYGPSFSRVFPILPKDRWGRHVMVGKLAVEDVSALAHWLEQALAQQQTSR
ncbi:hypothetical protein Kfla_1952 [Kribbella flavida DSM 17836]|uniref:PH domain-containing protein n=1 Tax=Kribbella flavida (strain DSM 17836 / JCM 10339 / NBRC 14399) TaxID=479435 RepID=D2PQR3_KRIFD|nr:hypothetical protein [Kribbella flavida]ADB31046.1 hypothetical protein Kfla_1952 [Kribbella flavida DSM 17836]